MSRPQRILRKRFVIYCDGDTEYNYVNQMRVKQGVDLALKPINMAGGGYTKFLEVIKSDAKNNCLAKFIIIDADRAAANQGERRSLEALLAYCILQHSKGTIPHFLILNSPDFEYVACLHDPKYKGESTESYIRSKWGFSSLNAFKSETKVYDLLNSSGRSFEKMLDIIRNGRHILINTFVINKKHYDVKITKTKLNPEEFWSRGSNLFEFFDVIDW